MTRIDSTSGVAPHLPPPNATASSNGTLRTMTTPSAQIDGMQDQLAKIFVYLSAMQNEQAENGRHGIDLARAGEKIARAQRSAELAAAARAARARDKGGVFGWIKKDIGVLGVVGLATFNYGLVAADVALHKSGVVRNLKLDVADGVVATLAYIKPELVVADILLRKLDVAPDEVKKILNDAGLGTNVPGVSDEDVKPIVDKMVTLNLLVAGTAASILSAGSTTALVVALVAAAMSAGAFVSSETGGPEWLTIGLGVAGAAASLGSGICSGVSAAQSTEAAARIGAARVAASAITGVNAGIGAVDQAIATGYQRDVDAHTRSAEEAKFALQRLERIIDDLIETLKDGKNDQKRASDTVTAMLESYDNSLIHTSSIRA